MEKKIICVVVNQMTDLTDLKSLQKRPQHKSITDLKSKFIRKWLGCKHSPPVTPPSYGVKNDL